MLSEPIELQAVPKVIQAFIKNRKAQLLPGFGSSGGGGGSKGSYGMVDRIIDGIKIDVDMIHITVDTLGTIKAKVKPTWKPPKMILELSGVSFDTTNENWRAVDLKEAREYNKSGSEFVYIFKQLQIQAISVNILSTTECIQLLNNMPLAVNVTMKKLQQENTLVGISAEVVLDKMKLSVSVDQLAVLVSFALCISSCFQRKLPKTEKSESSLKNKARMASIFVGLIEVILMRETLDESEITSNAAKTAKRLGVEKRGLLLELKDLQFGLGKNLILQQGDEKYDAMIDICLGFLGIKEYSNWNGPSSTYILEPDYETQFKTDFGMVAKTLNPEKQGPKSTFDKPHLFYIRALNGDCETNMYSSFLSGTLNPLKLSIESQSLHRLFHLGMASFSSIAQFLQDEMLSLEAGPADAAPQAESTTDTTKSALAKKKALALLESFCCDLAVESIKINFPQENSKDTGLSFVLSNFNLSSKPELPFPRFDESDFKGSVSEEAFDKLTKGDLINTRYELQTNHTSILNFKIGCSVGVYLQTIADPTIVKSLIAVPNIDFSFRLFLNSNEKGVETTLFEGLLNIDVIQGQLTQLQYQTLFKRVDEILFLLPLAFKLSQLILTATTLRKRTASPNKKLKTKKPKIPTSVVAKVGSISWLLCNDQLGEERQQQQGLAQLDLDRLCFSFEISDQKHTVTKLCLMSMKLTSLVAGKNKSVALYDPSAFISLNEDQKIPMLLLRVDSVSRSADPENKEKSDMFFRLSGIRWGMNAGASIDIMRFFLDNDRSLIDFIGSFQKAILTVVKEYKEQKKTKEAQKKIKTGSAPKPTANKVKKPKKKWNFVIVLEDLKLYLLPQQYDYSIDEDTQTIKGNGNVCISVGECRMAHEHTNETERNFIIKLNGYSIAANTQATAEDKNFVVSYITEPTALNWKSQKKRHVITNKWKTVLCEGGLDKPIIIKVDPKQIHIWKFATKTIPLLPFKPIVTSFSTLMKQGKKMAATIIKEVTDKDGNPVIPETTHQKIDQALKSADSSIAKCLESFNGSGSTKPKAQAPVQPKKGQLYFLQQSKCVKRWMELSGSKLYVYESVAGSSLVGTVTITQDAIAQTFDFSQLTSAHKDAYLAVPELKNEHPHIMQIQSNGKTFYFVGTDEGDLTAWVIAVVQLQCSLLEGNDKGKEVPAAAAPAQNVEQLQKELENIKKQQQELRALFEALQNEKQN
eukprot:TRINITY_DN6205_c0_g1_i1.p1 TRINITY_DN6205_c0_g1~~TRINITY_DN6205_c0_g1_i1.p1  ORF type:complete len:1208 (-),score=491.63 TRINITY_DN6205_c0_g1_i1:84-3707(-)